MQMKNEALSQLKTSHDQLEDKYADVRNKVSNK
jgi:hypothetical protein